MQRHVSGDDGAMLGSRICSRFPQFGGLFLATESLARSWRSNVNLPLAKSGLEPVHHRILTASPPDLRKKLPVGEDRDWAPAESFGRELRAR